MTATATAATGAAASGGPSSQGGVSGATQEAAKKTATVTRDYIVLQKRDDLWQPVDGPFNATSDRNAVKAAMEKLGVKEGSFVAVAVGSWHEHTRTVQTVEEARWQ